MTLPSARALSPPQRRASGDHEVARAKTLRVTGEVGGAVYFALAALPAGSEPSHCVYLVSLAGLSEAEIDDAVSRLAPIRSAACT